MAKSEQPKRLTEKRNCLDADFEAKLYALIATPAIIVPWITSESFTWLSLLTMTSKKKHKLSKVF